MIPLQKPLLPSAEKIFPYIKKIDQNRWYSNSGPLVTEFEERIGSMMNCHVAACSSATLGLTASLLVLKEQAKEKYDNDAWRYVSMPSWTFVATANAVVLSGMTPDIVDHQNGTVIGVSEFGAPVNGNHCLIDAAGAFDAYSSGLSKVGSTPVVISTHATKTFSTGEGGIVLSTDKNFIERVKVVINHGLDINKVVSIGGLNGKMSEYHAAVGLASLDEWAMVANQWLLAEQNYAKKLGIKPRLYASSIFPLKIDKSVNGVLCKLADKGIMSRLVWGRGIHTYPAYKDYPRTDMTQTEYQADHTLFLPFAIDMTNEQMEYVARAVHECV